MSGIFCTLVLVIGLFCSVSQGAKIESVANKNVTIFLESIQDENVKAGQIVHLVDGNGKKMAELKIVENRGLMADAKVVSGSVKKTYKVLMPHMIKSAPPSPPKVVQKPIKKKPKIPIYRPKPIKKPIVTVKAKPKVVRKAKPKPKPKPKPKAKAKVKPKAKPKTKVAALQTRPKTTKPKSQKAKAAKKTPEPKPVAVTDPEPDIVEEPDDDSSSGYDEQSSSATNSTEGKNWNLSMDILSLAGLFFDYQVFGFMFERRIVKSLSLGLKFNFGTFETNEGRPVTERPIVRRNEIGGYLRYSFSDDALGKGFFTTLSVQTAQETWVASATFPGTSESGLVYGFNAGYQWIFKSISIRLGYAAQSSSLSSELEVDGVKYERSSSLLSGLAHYAILQVGFIF